MGNAYCCTQMIQARSLDPLVQQQLAAFIYSTDPYRLKSCRRQQEGNDMQQILWQDRFNIGVEIVDLAHHKLFSIVDKMIELYVERHENKFACVEGIKYFKSYALKHFAEEEAYMREIGYSGYLTHKKHHDRMRWQTLPELEQSLYDSDFSTEAVQRFIGVCTGWLTGHIMIEDRAITGKTVSQPTLINLNDELSIIRAVILHPLQEMFGCNVQFVGKFSTKDTIVDAHYYELIYSTQEGKKLRFILVIGERLLLSAAGLMFGIDFYARSEIVRFAMQEISQNLIQRAAVGFGVEPNKYQLESDRFLEKEEYDQIFKDQAPQYNLLFQVKEDCFALCIDQIPEASRAMF